MGRFKLRPFLLLFLAAVCFGQEAYAVSIVLSDFDGTLVETHKSLNGAFSTKVLLLPLKTRENTLIDPLKKEQPIEIESQDYYRIEKYLGKEKAHGQLGVKVTLEDGRVIFPAHYYTKHTESFNHFQESDDPSRNYLIENFKDAVVREKEQGKVIPGQFWEVAQVLLSNEETAKHFGILSARGNSSAEYKAFFEYIKTHPAFEHDYSPNYKYFFSTSRKEFEKYDATGNVSKLKAAVLEEISNQLGRINLTPEDIKISPDGKSRGLYHSLIFADDNQENLEGAIRLFQSLAQRRIFPIKFIIVNTGTPSEIEKSERPQNMVIKPDGTFRKAAPLEILGEPQTLSQKQINWLRVKKCSSVLGLKE